MKKNIIKAALFAASALVFVSCAKEASSSEFAAKKGFSGVIAAFDNTKTTLNASDKVLWSEGDLVNINGSIFSATPIEDGAKADFTKVSGEDPVAPFVAYYPASIFDGTKASLPQVQNYAAGQISNSPMYAAGESGSLNFKNICAIIEFTLYGSNPVSFIEISAGSKALCGDFSIVDGKAVLDNPDAADMSITLNCGGVELAATGTTFWAAIPEGKYPLCFRITDSEGNVLERDTKSAVAVEANHIYAFDWETVDDFSSLSFLPDGAVVELKTGAVVVAASKESAILSDGTVYMYAQTATPMNPGDYVQFTAQKNSVNNMAYLSVAEWSAMGIPAPAVKDPDPKFYQLSYSEPVLYTAVSGVLGFSAGVYTITAGDGNYTYGIDNPLDVFGFSGITPGSYVCLTGYVVADSVFVVKTARKLEMTINPNWTISYAESSDKNYPEEFTNTVSGTGNPNYCLVGAAAKANVDAAGGAAEYAKTSAIGASEELYYYTYYYGSYGYTYQEIYDLLTYSSTASETFSELTFGEYVFFVVGLDEMANPSGDYAVLEFEKKDSSVFANYDDFLGKWSLDGNKAITISENVNGTSYKIKGFYPSNANSYSESTALDAVYDSANGKMLIYEQVVGDFNHTSYGACQDCLLGAYLSGEYYKMNYIVNSNTPAVAIIANLEEDGTVSFKAGSCPNGAFEKYYFQWLIVDPNSPNYHLGNSYGSSSYPNTLTKLAEASEAYKKWLGDWTITDAQGTKFPITINENIPDESYTIAGLEYDAFLLFFDSKTGNTHIDFVNFGTIGGYSLYCSGITNTGYVAMGDDDDVLCRLTLTSDTEANITSVVDGNGVYADCWGVMAYGGGNWYSASDNFVYNPATMAKSAATSAAVKSQLRASKLAFTPIQEVPSKFNKVSENRSYMKVNAAQELAPKTSSIVKVPVKPVR